MTRTDDTRYGILELVQLTGIPRRTIRYYVQRGLLEAPSGAGRGHYYTKDHLRKLRQIRDLQGKGHSLDEIDRLLKRGAEDPQQAFLPPVELATRITVAPGVELLISHGHHFPSPAQLRALATAAREILNPLEGDD